MLWVSIGAQWSAATCLVAQWVQHLAALAAALLADHSPLVQLLAAQQAPYLAVLQVACLLAGSLSGLTARLLIAAA